MTGCRKDIIERLSISLFNANFLQCLHTANHSRANSFTKGHLSAGQCGLYISYLIWFYKQTCIGNILLLLFFGRWGNSETTWSSQDTAGQWEKLGAEARVPGLWSTSLFCQIVRACVLKSLLTATRKLFPVEMKAARGPQTHKSLRPIMSKAVERMRMSKALALHSIPLQRGRNTWITIPTGFCSLKPLPILPGHSVPLPAALTAFVQSQDYLHCEELSPWTRRLEWQGSALTYPWVSGLHIHLCPAWSVEG